MDNDKVRQDKGGLLLLLLLLYLVGEVVPGLECSCWVFVSTEFAVIPFGCAVRHHGDLTGHRQASQRKITEEKMKRDSKNN